jgi:nitrite reductase/ring-hydroxylating ferredoxin subunit
METNKATKRERELELSRRKTKKNRLVIISVVVVAIIGVSVYFAMFGGNGGNGGNNQSNGPIKAMWIEPQVVDDTVSILRSEVEDNWNIHFNVNTQGEDMNFMAYVLDGEIYVRANVCPPCRSIGFSLDEAILICDRCATTFESETGEGIQGACVDFPKASVPYQIDGGNIVMNSADLIAAYEDTLEPG